MKDFVWTVPLNVTLYSTLRSQQQQQMGSFSQLLLPLSIASLFTYRKFYFPIDTKIIHFSPLQIIECRTSKISNLNIQSHSSLIIDRADFNSNSKIIQSINAPMVSLTHSTFNEFNEAPFSASGTKNVKIKWTSFQAIRKHRAVTISNVEYAHIETNNFTNLVSGAISSQSSIIKIRGCTFYENSGSDGGAVFFDDSSNNITFCVFSFCESNRGGAIFINNGNLTAENTVFYQNSGTKGESIFTNIQISLISCNFTGLKISEIEGESLIVDSNFDTDSIEVKFGPPPTETFSPSPSRSYVPPFEAKQEKFWTRNTKLIVGCCTGIGGGILIVVIVFIVVAKIKAANNPKIYVAEATTEKKMPTGSTYVTKSYSLR